MTLDWSEPLPPHSHRLAEPALGEQGLGRSCRGLWSRRLLAGSLIRLGGGPLPGLRGPSAAPISAFSIGHPRLSWVHSTPV